MRPIKFRGKGFDSGEWVYGGIIYYPICKEPYIQEYGVNHRNEEYTISTFVIPETVGQFTGLLDKNGVEIFEGDVIEGQKSSFVNNPIGVVTYCGLAFCYIGKNYKNKFWRSTITNEKINMDYGIEIIGNIHDNPELLNKGETHEQG